MSLGSAFGAQRKQSRAQGRAGLSCGRHGGLRLPLGNRSSHRRAQGWRAQAGGSLQGSVLGGAGRARTGEGSVLREGV